MENKKQTAVEWLIDQLDGYPPDCEIFQEAKEMEKRQTFEDFRRGLDISIQEAYRIAQKSWAREHRTQQYYNETYGK